ncbi:amidohydrolase family protein [Dactylosporangium roseum]|uniref:Amidohydrolase family protein n=1 Tax=Dactylosporangium roseum TaxID=47989 RepID=A0ABY5ZG98_9ACTN|nr:amidohydrolase family protein [Dactylosporangium roseum]UWZ39990.1 amidohydrolase family protein [Dactylosporangium roseum]
MRTEVRNVRVFDGRRLHPPDTIVIDGERFGGGTGEPRVVDGEGAVALPGLIDAHLHLDRRTTLERLARFGVTTALDMACGPPELVEALRISRGLTDIRSAGIPAVAPGSWHTRIPVLGERGVVTGADEAERFVAERLAEGSDYLKIIISDPEPSHDQATLNALVTATHRRSRQVVAHVTSGEAVAKALRAGVDILTHAPLDQPLGRDTADRMAVDGQELIPTLTMMEGVVAASARSGALYPGASYAAARDSVTTAYRAGVPILAGTDANSTPEAPAHPSHGDSLHHELELLVDAGLSALDALRAATVLPAIHFGLVDRGAIEPGHRADLVLVDGDPLHDIRATRSITRVWCGGVEHTPAELAGTT